MSVFKLEAEIGLNSDAFKKGLAAAGESMKKMSKVSAASVSAVYGENELAGVVLTFKRLYGILSII